MLKLITEFDIHIFYNTADQFVNKYSKNNGKNNFLAGLLLQYQVLLPRLIFLKFLLWLEIYILKDCYFKFRQVLATIMDLRALLRPYKILGNASMIEIYRACKRILFDEDETKS